MAVDVDLRALDEAVAMRVMGWQRQPSYNYWMTFPDGSFELHALIATWKPSTDIATAFTVVESLRARGIWTHVQTFTHTARVEMGIPSSECQEWGETVAQAICKCALKAVGKFSAESNR